MTFRRARHAILALAILPLAACALPYDGPVARFDRQGEATVRNQVAFETRRFVVAPGTDTTSLHAFIVDIAPQMTDRFIVEAPAGVAGDRQADAVLGFLQQRRLPAERRVVGTDAPVVLVVERVALTVPRCPVLPRAPAIGGGFRSVRQPGCSNITNLGRMVADPRDLVHGRALAPADGATAAAAVEAYRGDGKTEQNAGDAMPAVFAKAFGKAGAQ